MFPVGKDHDVFSPQQPTTKKKKKKASAEPKRRASPQFRSTGRFQAFLRLTDEISFFKQGLFRISKKQNVSVSCRGHMTGQVTRKQSSAHLCFQAVFWVVQVFLKVSHFDSSYLISC